MSGLTRDQYPPLSGALHVRWGLRNDLPRVLAIETASFDGPWTEEDFLTCLRRRSCIAMVAECGESIVGFMVYELCPDSLELLNFAVRPDLRRRGIGSALVAKLKYKCASHGRGRIGLAVYDENLPAQLFFRAQGFRAIGVLRDYFPDGRVGYRMERVSRDGDL